MTCPHTSPLAVSAIIVAPTAATIRNALVNSNYKHITTTYPTYLDAEGQTVSLVNRVGLHPGHGQDDWEEVGARADAEGHEDPSAFFSLELHEGEDCHDGDPYSEDHEG